MMLLTLPLLLLVSVPSFARHVSVSGKCDIKVTPDRGSVQLLTEKTASTVKEAVDVVSKQIDAVKAQVQKLGLKDLELRTTQFQVSPHHNWENNRNVFKGYRASLGLEVETSEIVKLGDVMARAAGQGINNTNNYRTFLSLEKSQREYLKCLDIASEDALKKAKQLAKNMNAKLGEIESITEGTAHIEEPRPMVMMEAAMAKSADGAGPSIEVGNQTYSASVRYVFKLQ